MLTVIDANAGDVDTSDLYSRILGSVGRTIHEPSFIAVTALFTLAQQDHNHPIAGKYFKVSDKALAAHKEKELDKAKEAAVRRRGNTQDPAERQRILSDPNMQQEIELAAQRSVDRQRAQNLKLSLIHI